jgi:hypothetical protein
MGKAEQSLPPTNRDMDFSLFICDISGTYTLKFRDIFGYLNSRDK